MRNDPATFLGYRAYGFNLVSELPIPELPAGDPSDAAFRVVIGADLPAAETSKPSPDGAVGFSILRTAERVELAFPGSATFVLSDDASTIEVRARRGAAASTLSHLLIDHVVPAALSERGELVLHASGVALPTGAVLFVGPSGSGKSTMAAVLARRGWPVLCDDGARLVADGDRATVAPSYPGLRLLPDGVAALVGRVDGLTTVAQDSSKRRWVPGEQPAGPVPLACVCLLDFGSGPPEVCRVPPREGLMHLLDNSHRLRGSDPALVRAQFDRAARLVRTTPVFQLWFSDGFEAQGQLAELVESLAAPDDGGRSARSSGS